MRANSLNCTLLIFASLVYLLLSFACCNPSKYYENLIYYEENGLLIERFTHDSLPILNYEADNKIYRRDREFVYRYYYLSKKGDTLLVGNSGYELLSIGQAYQDASAIIRVSFKVDTVVGDRMRQMLPDYYQSGVSYNYYNPFSTTIPPFEGAGLVENEHNIWLHPFRRQTYFAMLNMNAYPYVKFPLKVGNTWRWELGIGGKYYLNPLWTDWTENTIRYHEYTITDKFKMSFFGADIDVWEITAKTTGEAGPASAIFYFNSNYGFISMKYTTVLGTEFVFNLESSLTCGPHY